MPSSLSIDSVFVRQNIWLKLCIMLVGSVAAIVLPVRVICYLLTISVMFLLLSPSIFKFILRGIRVALPFLAIYSLIATIVGMTIDKIIIFIIRIIIMVLLVTYFAASFRLKRFVEDSKFLRRSVWVKSVLFYMTATLVFLRKFGRYYYEKDESETKTYSLSKAVSKLIDAIHDNWQMRNQIQNESELLLGAEYQKPLFFKVSNVLGCIYITIVVLILAL